MKINELIKRLNYFSESNRFLPVKGCVVNTVNGSTMNYPVKQVTLDIDEQGKLFVSIVCKDE